MDKTKKNSKALKNTAGNGGFFRALIFGFVSCFAVWILLALIFSLVMSKQTDSTAFVSVLSPAVVVVSLLVGGYVAGKTDKSCSALCSFVLGCAVLGICYGVSVSMDLSKELSSVMKTVLIAVMLVCPMLGARISNREKKRKPHSRKRL